MERTRRLINWLIQRAILPADRRNLELYRRKLLIFFHGGFGAFVCLGMLIFSLRNPQPLLSLILGLATTALLGLSLTVRPCKKPLRWIGFGQVVILSAVIVGTFFLTRNYFLLNLLTLIPALAIALCGFIVGVAVLLSTLGFMAWLSLTQAPHVYILTLGKVLPEAIHYETISVVVYLLLAITFTLVSLFELTLRRTLAAYYQEKEKEEEANRKRQAVEVQLSNNLLFLETLLENLPLPVWYQNRHQVIIGCNSALASFLGCQKSELIHKKIKELHLGPISALFQESDDVAYAGGFTSFEAQISHADGTVHDTIVFKSPLVNPGGEVTGITATLVDVTQKKRQESRLQALHETRNKLFSVISHDLRSPVSKIQQFLAFYQDQRSIFDPPTWEILFGDLRRSADSLRELLDNLFLWLSNQQDKLRPLPERLDFAVVAEELGHLYQAVAQTKQQTLEIHNRLTGKLFTDRNMLSTILRNLVNNAIKFTPRHGRISLTASETSAGAPTFAVTDSGLGIPADRLTTLFSVRDGQASFGTDKEAGTGFGLSLCADLAQALGARLEVTSTVGSGSCFTLPLPPAEELGDQERSTVNP